MRIKLIFFPSIRILIVGIFAYLVINPLTNNAVSDVSKDHYDSSSVRTAVLGNGCFWCVESDLEKVPGTISVVSGYAGGKGQNPNYENYAKNGFREVVQVSYDPKILSFGNLVEHILKHGDPTDPAGSFGDRGVQYAPAIYYSVEEEKQIAEAVITKANALKTFTKPIVIALLPSTPFYSAEEYHQDYSKKNPLRYSFFRGRSGRDDFIKKYWSNEEKSFTNSNKTEQTKMFSWKEYVKPSDDELKKKLTAIEYSVTQEDGTESPFANKFDGFKEDGIFVDLLSGEPLYSSKDKFDSGTGWPSFVKPISPGAVVLKEDRGFFSSRTEVRSSIANNHLGHVFDDGPSERGGKRYCMNSAALRFVPRADMEREGYGDYLK